MTFNMSLEFAQEMQFGVDGDIGVLDNSQQVNSLLLHRKVREEKPQLLGQGGMI